MSKELKNGQKLYLKKENAPMGLTVGERYGKIINIDGDTITVESITGKITDFVNDGRKSNFITWFTTTKKKVDKSEKMDSQ